MKIQLDTKEKTITIEEQVNIKEFITIIKKLLPNNWNEYSLKVSVIYNWWNPITITTTTDSSSIWTNTNGTSVYNICVE